MSSDETRTNRWHQLALAGATVIGLAIIWHFRLRGWFPHDDGVLGQSAQRVLRGEVPHRDFDDPYTGGVSLFHALAFRLSGVSLVTLRNWFAVVASIWFVGVVFLFTRWLSPLAAAVAALFLAVWSVPLYPAAMPSWYVLFLVIAAAGMLLVVRRPRLAAFAAGLCIGVAALAKVTAVFGLAGAGWALVALRQHDDPERPASPEVAVAAAVLIFLIARLVTPLLDLDVFVHLALPPMVLVAAVGLREMRQARRFGIGFDRALYGRLGTLAIGFALPAGCFIAWLSRHDALVPFAASIESVIGRRATSASWPPPATLSILLGLPLAAIALGMAVRLKARPVFLVAVAAAIWVLALLQPNVHEAVWDGLRALLPLCASAFAVDLFWQRPTRQGADQRALAILAPFAAMMILTQFPFAAPVYFLYVLPLFVLAITAWSVRLPQPSRRMLGGATAFLILLAVVQVIPGAPEALQTFAITHVARARLNLPRGGLMLVAEDVARYEQLSVAVNLAPPGPIWAGPDAPEVAFLAQRRDANRHFFAFLADEDSVGVEFTATLLARGVQAVVIHVDPEFSVPLSTAVRDSVARHFPFSRTVDDFEVHWRKAGP